MMPSLITHLAAAGLAVAVAACIASPPIVAQPAASRPVDDPALAAEAARRAGGTDVASVVEGGAMGTVFSFEAEAGHCYDLGIAVSDGDGVTLRLEPNDRVHIYPSTDGMYGPGRGVAHPVCVDSAGPVHVVLTVQMSVGFGGHGALATVRFAVAGRKRAESGAEQRLRHRRQRERFHNERRARCDELSSSAGYQCMKELEAELAERDGLAAAATGSDPTNVGA